VDLVIDMEIEKEAIEVEAVEDLGTEKVTVGTEQDSMIRRLVHLERDFNHLLEKGVAVVEVLEEDMVIETEAVTVETEKADMVVVVETEKADMVAVVETEKVDMVVVVDTAEVKVETEKVDTVAEVDTAEVKVVTELTEETERVDTVVETEETEKVDTVVEVDTAEVKVVTEEVTNLVVITTELILEGSMKEDLLDVDVLGLKVANIAELKLVQDFPLEEEELPHPEILKLFPTYCSRIASFFLSTLFLAF